MVVVLSMESEVDNLLRSGIRRNVVELPLLKPQVIPGRPDLAIEIREYEPNEHGIRKAKRDVPYLFSAFSQPPELLAHLQYAVTAQGGWGDEFEDFRGFRLAVLLPCRQEITYRSIHGEQQCVSATSGSDERRESSNDSSVLDDNLLVRVRIVVPPLVQNTTREKCQRVKLAFEYGRINCKRKRASYFGEGENVASLKAMHFGRPVSCATIRGTPDFLEIPFWATKPERRKQGYARALLRGIEDIARKVGAPEIMLPSAEDPEIRAVWAHLGFKPLRPDFPRLGSPFTVRLANATELVKRVPPPPSMLKLVVKHRELSHIALANANSKDGDGLCQGVDEGSNPSSSTHRNPHRE